MPVAALCTVLRALQSLHYCVVAVDKVVEVTLSCVKLEMAPCARSVIFIDDLTTLVIIYTAVNIDGPNTRCLVQRGDIRDQFQ